MFTIFIDGVSKRDAFAGIFVCLETKTDGIIVKSQVCLDFTFYLHYICSQKNNDLNIEFMYPLKFKPILKQTIWGGDKIAGFKHLNTSLTDVGESWEISGVEGNESIVSEGELAGFTLNQLIDKFKEKLVGKGIYQKFGGTFPLLIKFIDAKQSLSVQVHPSDELAMKRHHSLGKNEMWYVISAEDGASLISGFKHRISPDEYKEQVHNGTFVDSLRFFPVNAGDVFNIPSGRVHGIGAGVFIAEIQETSDITYRIYDYQRKDKNGNYRELHTDLAIDAINFDDDSGEGKVAYSKEQNVPVEVLSCPFFTTSVYNMTEPILCDYSELDSFVIYICVEGSCDVVDDAEHTVSLCSGESVLFPAITKNVRIIPRDSVKIIETFV